MRKKLTCFILMITVLLACQAVPVFAVADEEPDVGCQAAMLIDARTGKVLYQKNKDKPMAPASLTKMMTCLISIEELDMDQEVTITSESTNIGGNNLELKEGEVLTVDELLHVLMIYSANDAAVALAVAVSGSEQAFVAKMNERAKELGCKGTHYLNPNGLTNDIAHITTASDLYLIASELMSHKEAREIVRMKNYTLPATNKSKERKVKTTNRLLTKQKYEGTYGIKTGFMAVSGYCFVGACQRERTDLICVVLNASERDKSFDDAKALFDYGFTNYHTEELIAAGESVGKVKVKYGHNTFVEAVSGDGAYLTLPKEADASLATSKVVLDKGITAPLKKGDKVGTVEIYEDGEKVDEADVTITKSVKRGGPWTALYISDMVFAIIMIVVCLIIVLMIATKTRARKRRKAKAEKRRQAQEEYERILAAERADKEKRNWPF